MSNLFHYTALLAAILLTLGSQILLRLGATREARSVNPITAGGLVMLGLATILAVIALQGIMLKTVIALNALTFVGMPIAAKFFLDERLTRESLIASTVIVIGILVFLMGG